MRENVARIFKSLVVIAIVVEVPLVAYLEGSQEFFIQSWHHHVFDSTPRKQHLTVLKYPAYNSTIKQALDKRLKEASENKVILVWAPAFGQTNPQHISRKDCGNCEVVFDKSKIHHESTGAVLFHFDTVNIDDMPATRYPNQLHIFWSMEASANLMYQKYFPTVPESYQFNATMTYRLDSDFLSSYQSPHIGYQLMGKNSSVLGDIMKLKSKLAIAIVSDCSILPGAKVRLQKIKELKKLGLLIDTFGWCFSRRLSRADTSSTIKKYKFYFSYENSYHCKDYITEKFFNNALLSDAVPVVWGAVKEDYEAISPPNSFVFAEDFSTPQELIKYLNFLDKHDEEYLKYMRWRTMPPRFLPHLERERGFCAICRALHGINVDDIYNPKYNESKPPLFTDGVRPRTVLSLQYWFYGEDNPECFQKFYKT